MKVSLSKWVRVRCPVCDHIVIEAPPDYEFPERLSCPGCKADFAAPTLAEEALAPDPGQGERGPAEE